MPKTVHIALVGGQPAPVFYGIYATQPDSVVFIYSVDSENPISRIKERLTASGFHGTFVDSAPLDPTDPVLITQRAETIRDSFSKDIVFLNITGGTKSWSYLFAKVFESHPDTSVIYVDQLNRLWNYRESAPRQIEPLNLVHHLELYGNPLKVFTRFQDFTEEDKQVSESIEAARQFNYKDFNELTTILSKEKNHRLNHFKTDKWPPLPSGSYVEWGKLQDHSWVRLVLSKGSRIKEFFWESKHAVKLVFNSGWFEYKVAAILSKWPDAKDILLNCHFRTQKNADKNETDIIIQTSNRLLFVECKTQLTKLNDIDKFHSVVKAYGGSASLGLFITEAPMDESGREKCEDMRLLPPFALSMDYAGLPTERALFLLLDKAIAQINK